MCETIFCVRCLRPARMWCGHLRIPQTVAELWPYVCAGQHVTAGWCCESCELGGFRWVRGKLEPCVGDWRFELGLRDERGRVLVKGGRKTVKR